MTYRTNYALPVYRRLWYTLIFAVIFFTCQSPNPAPTVLQVGQIKLDAKELGRYLKRYQRKQHLAKLTREAAENYISNELTEHLLFLNEALAKGYEQHPEVVKRCLLMEKKYLTAGDGLIYRRFLQDSLGLTDKGLDQAGQQQYRRQLENYASALKSKLLDSVKISVNQPVFEAFYEKYYCSGYYFRKQILEKFSLKERAQHFFKYDSVDVTLGEWIDYYRSYPVVRIIENRQMLREHLEQYAFEQLAYRYAQRTGLLKDEKLLKFLKSYREKQVVDIFLNEKAAAEIKITEAEMRAEYEKNKVRYRTEPVVGIITIEFLTRKEALKIIHACRQQGADFGEMKRKYEKQMRTQKEIVRYFTPSNIPYLPHSNIAFTMKINSMSAPILIPRQQQYLLIKKIEQVEAKQLSFQAAQHEIEKNIIAEKYAGFQIRLINSLKNQNEVFMEQRLITEYLLKRGR